MGTSGWAVEVEGLVVRRGPITAVDGIDFGVQTGSTTMLLGPNGAGKTSTIEHLEGYLRRAAGSVSVLGLDPQTQWPELAPRVGLMLQSGGIQTAIRPRELLSQYSSFFEHPMPTDELLERVGLADRSGTAYRKLSGGEQQRLSLALALVGRPELLFLDEPTAGVDIEGRDLIRGLISELAAGGTTVLLSTHDLADAEQLADKVLIIDRGCIVADGTPAELMGAAEGEHLHFSAARGLDLGSLAATANAPVQEVSPGEYTVDAPPTPELVATVTGWLAAHDQPLADLRANRKRLEDVFRRLTSSSDSFSRDGSGGSTGEATDTPGRTSDRLRRSRARRGNGSGEPQR